MADDEFRVEVDIHESVHGHVAERLRTLDLHDEVQKRLGDRVVVTRDGEKMFVYTQSGDAAKEAEGVVRQVLSEEGIEGETRRRRWNADDRFWQDADEPVQPDPDAPADPAETATGKDVPHPFFVFLEGHEPEFLRDLGV